MPKRTVRGAKRKCQNEDCDASFYDLNRDEFDCPICGTAFDHEVHASALAQRREEVPDYVRRKQARSLPVVASVDASEDGANDNEAVAEEGSDPEVITEDETAIAEAPDVLLDEDEDEQDSLADGVPRTVSDDQEQ